MFNNFFVVNESFESIINTSLKDIMGVTSIYSIKPIYTGWTNIVYRVTANNGNYYLRFPRDEFWSRTIVKDYQFACFINGKTSFNTVDLKLAYDNEMCLVHGDLNLSNVIVDSNNNISAVIDFGFAGFGSKYFDLSRLLSRNFPSDFRFNLIKYYEEFENSKLDIDKLDTTINTWKSIDNAYINYMEKIGIYKR